MKRRIIIIITFCITLSGFALGQAREDTAVKTDIPGKGPSGYIALSAGVQFPVSSYRSAGYFAGPTSAMRFNTGPYVKTGTMLSLSFGKPIKYSDFGIAATAACYQNRFDVNGYISDMNREQIGVFTAGSSSMFRISSVTAGLFCTLPRNKFSLDARFMCGLVYIHTPDITYTGTNNVIAGGPVSGDWSLGSGSKLTGTFDMGAQARYFITNRFCLLLSSDFFFSSAVRDMYSGNATPYVIGNSIAVSLLSLEAGVGYKL